MMATRRAEEGEVGNDSASAPSTSNGRQQEETQAPSASSALELETATPDSQDAIQDLVASLALDENSDAKANNDDGDDEKRRSSDNMADDRDTECTNVPAPSPSILRPCMEPALIDALRNPRDRIFISKHAKDFEERIKDTSCQQWELPLMNTYQRLLVHKVADHFNLQHNLEPTTKAIILNKQESTTIPEKSLIELVECERLSEPSFTLATPPSGMSGLPAGAASAGIKIMKRDVSRSQSPRVSAGEDAKDRRMLTMAEKETKYREARQRIFGEDEPAETGSSKKSSASATPSQTIDVQGIERQLSERSQNLSSSSPPSPSFVRSTAKPYAAVRTSATPPLHDPYQPSQFQAYNSHASASNQYPYGYPAMGQPLAQYPPANYANFANSGQNRPFYHFQQQTGPGPYAWSGPQGEGAGIVPQAQASPSASSRSTSISTDAGSVTGGEGSGSETRSAKRSGPPTPFSYGGSGTPLPASQLPNQQWYPFSYQAGPESMPPGNYGYPAWAAAGQPPQPQTGYGSNHPTLHHRHSTGASGREHRVSSSDSQSRANARPPQHLVRPPFLGQSPGASPSVSPTAQLNFRPPSPTNSINLQGSGSSGSGSAGGLGRGRRGDRALYDPNAPPGSASPMSPTSNGQGEKQPVGKSASAGALLGNGSTSAKASNRVLSHPSLPRRPDWAVDP